MSQIYKIDINSNLFKPTHNINSNVVSSSPLDWMAYSFIRSLKNSTNKFNTLNTDLLDNSFIINNKKKELFNTFIKGQFIYRAFCKFAAIYKYNKAKLYDINTDLCLRPLNELRSYNILILLENNVKYTFRLSDLITISNTALSYSPNFFATPLTVKNPYTNIEFTITNMYNIYFAIKRSNLIMPILLHQYFMSKFDLYVFLQFSETIIRDIAINAYVDNTYYNILYKEVNDMIQSYSYIFEKIHIHPRFPKKILVQLMRPYLKLHYYYLYSYNEMNRISSRKLLKKKLRLFVKNNQKFGRIIYKFQFEDNLKQVIDVSESFVINNNHKNRDTRDGVVIIDETTIESNYEPESEPNYEPDYDYEYEYDSEHNYEAMSIDTTSSNSIDENTINDENTNDENTNDENTNDENTNDENTNDENTNDENTNDENTNDGESESLIDIRHNSSDSSLPTSEISRHGRNLFNINTMNFNNLLNSNTDDELVNTNYTTLHFHNEQEEEIIDRIVQEVQSTINRILTTDQLTDNINIQYEPIYDYNLLDNSNNPPI